MHEAEKLFMLDGFCNFSDNISSIWQLTSSALSCMVRFSSSSSSSFPSLCIRLLFVAVLVWIVLFLVRISTKFVVILRGWLFVFLFLYSIRFWLLWGVKVSFQAYNISLLYKTDSMLFIKQTCIWTQLEFWREKNLKCVDLYVYAFDLRRKKSLRHYETLLMIVDHKFDKRSTVFVLKRLIRIPFKVKNELKLKQINLCCVVSSCVYLIHIHLHFRTSK